MTDEFTASNGGIVWREAGGRLTFGNYLIIETDAEEALREWFRAQEDERLGRWRAPGDLSDYVVYPEAFQGDLVRVLRESDGLSKGYVRSEDKGEPPARHRVDHIRAARAYFEAHPEPKPRTWASAQVITWRDGAYLPQIAQRDPETLVTRDMGWYTWLGNDGRWFDEDALAQLIGDAEVTVLIPEES